MEWVENELQSLELGDKRLNARAKLVLKNFSNSPGKSIPSSHNGWHETKAAYRLLSNEKVSAEKILGVHEESTLKRMKEHETIILAQDRTELDYKGQNKKGGRGPTNHESHRGVYLHPLVAFTETGLCLGVVDAKIWHRTEIGNKEDYLTKPIEDKESFRWLEELRKLNELSVLLPEKKLIMVADRESDIIEVLSENLNSNVEYIIRGSHNRRLLGEENKLLDTLREAPLLTKIEFEFKERNQSSYRQVKQEIRIKKIQLKPSPGRGKRTGLKPVVVTALLATEKSAKKGCEPLEWLLLTSIEIKKPEEALKAIEYYLLRWKIEIYFKVLKSGCQVEKLQLDGLERLSTCLALYMIVAWRVMYLIQLGRECPQMSCEVFFGEEEWRAAYMVHRRKRPPKLAPSLNEMVGIVARLGGFLGRSGDGNPGPKHLWIGIQRTRDFMYALQVQDEILGANTYG